MLIKCLIALAIAQLCVVASSSLFESLPIETLDYVCLNSDPRTAMSLLLTSQLFYEQFSSYYHEMFYQDNESGMKLSLYKIYQYWKCSQDEEIKKQTEVVLRSHVNFSLLWSCLIHQHEFDATRFSEFHHGNEFFANFSSFIGTSHELISTDLLRIILEVHPSLEITSKQLADLLVDKIRLSKFSLLVDHSSYNIEGVKAYFNFIFILLGTATELNRLIRMKILKKLEMHCDITPDIVHTFVLNSSPDVLACYLNSFESSFDLNPLPKTIAFLVESREECLELFITKFPNATLTASQWSQAYASGRFSFESLVELLAHTPDGWINRETIHSLPKTIPIDIYLAFIARSTFRLSVDEIIDAMQRGLPASTIRYLMRRCSMLSPEQSTRLRTICNDLGYLNDLNNLIVQKSL